MWTRALLKENGKVAFRRNYWTCVIVSVLATFLCGGTVGGVNYNLDAEDTASMFDGTSAYEYFMQIPPYVWAIVATAIVMGTVLGLAISILVSNVAIVGRERYFLENREHKTDIGRLFYGFQGGRYSTTVLVMFLRSLYIFGWSLLFLIPGIIKSYSYMLVPYILAENTYLDRKRVFELSSQMMRGHKMEAFELSLSFIGWIFLGALSGGLVNIFYTQPYINATFAEFYSAIKAEAKMKGVFADSELPGVGEEEV